MSEEHNNTRYVDRAGVYACRVKKPGNGWFGEQGENNSPFIRIPAFVTDDGDQEGREIVFYAWLTDRAFDRSIETLCKVFPEWDGDLEALERGDFTFAGLDCEIVAEAETFEGKKRVKAKWLNPIGGGGGKAMDAGKVSSLISKLGRRAKAIAKQAGAGGTPQARPTSSRSTASDPAQSVAGLDDDIPF